MSLVTGLFFLVILLNQRWSPPLRLQASDCSAFRIMCEIPNIAVFCSESIECFPSTASKFVLKLLVTIPVAPIITGIIVHFRFHILCISIHKLLYFNFFSASFCTAFLSAGIATSISVHVFSFLFLNIICCNFSVCVYCLLLLLFLLLLLLLTAIDGSSPYTSTNKTNKNKYTQTKQYKNPVQTAQNTVNTSIHITKTPTHYKTHTYIPPRVIKQVKTTTVQVKTNTVQDIPKMK